MKIGTGFRAASLAAFLTAASAAPAMTVVPPGFDELVAESGRIVRARVVSAEPFRTTARDGREIIKTRVTWEVDRTLKGEPARTLTLEFLGGRIGDRGVHVPGMPQFGSGNDDYLFIAPNTASFCPLVAAGHGRYPVRTDGSTGRRFVARENGRPLADTAEVVQPLSGHAASAPAAGLSPEAFEQAVLQSLAASKEVANAH